MKAILFTIIGLSIFLTACSTVEITNFEECIAAGNPAMESHPRQCSDGENTFTEELDEESKTILMQNKEDGTYGCFGCGDDGEGRTICIDPAPIMETVKQTENLYCEGFEVINQERKPCTREYMPVCGEVEVQCITAPCDPIKTTFSNKCEAENANAENIVEGVCEDQAEFTPKGTCLSFDGNWIEEANECEGMPKASCEKLGGNFNECASACRNNPDAQICTMQCVQVCEFE